MDRYEQAALDTVNKILKDKHKRPVTKLLPGIPERHTSCPIATTLGSKMLLASTTMNSILLFDTHETYLIDIDTTMFIDLFDKGWYPHLRKEW